MSIKNPLVSIVVPSFNHAAHIEQCIESIIKQNYNNYELIVIDDGSIDNSPAILMELKEKYGFYLEINENQGLSKTLNRGFRDISKGKYLTFCASDDYWLPGKLDKQVQFLEKFPEYAMVYGKAQIVNELGEFDFKKTIARNRNLKGGRIFKELINIEFHPPVNYMLRSSVVKEIGYYREHIWAEDFDMNLRISNSYPIGFIDEYLSCYRVNNSIPNKNLTFKTVYSHKDSILLFKDSEHFDVAIKNWHYRCYAWYAPYTKGKMLALKGMLHNLDLIFTIRFLKTLARLIFVWK